MNYRTLQNFILFYFILKWPAGDYGEVWGFADDLVGRVWAAGSRLHPVFSPSTWTDMEVLSL